MTKKKKRLPIIDASEEEEQTSEPDPAADYGYDEYREDFTDTSFEDDDDEAEVSVSYKDQGYDDEYDKL